MDSHVESLSDNAAEFKWRHDDVFGRIASRYDFLCDVFSFGIHRLWKRSVARRIASEEWSTLLDGATGTGDIILRVLAHEITEGRNIIASDVSAKMLAIAQRRLAMHIGKADQMQQSRGIPAIVAITVYAFWFVVSMGTIAVPLVLRDHGAT